KYLRRSKHPNIRHSPILCGARIKFLRHVHQVNPEEESLLLTLISRRTYPYFETSQRTPDGSACFTTPNSHTHTPTHHHTHPPPHIHTHAHAHTSHIFVTL